MVHEMAVAGSLISQLAAKMFMKSTGRVVIRKIFPMVNFTP
jgi:hypothetical protein